MIHNLLNLKNINYENSKWFIANELRDNGVFDEKIALTCAYIIVKHSCTENSDISCLDSFVETTRIDTDVKDDIILNCKGRWNIILNTKAE